MLFGIKNSQIDICRHLPEKSSKTCKKFSIKRFTIEVFCYIVGLLSRSTRKFLHGEYMDHKKIIIVDSNEKDALELKTKLGMEEGILVDKIFSNADNALAYLDYNDIDLVITDIILQNSDGFDLLEVLSTEKHLNTKVIILSALNGDAFIQKALSLGADYYMIKPYSYNILLKRINDVLKSENDKKQKVESKIAENNVTSIDGKLSNIFITVGIPAHIKGYQFLREAIKMAIETPDIINSITKKLYPSIAKKFDTSSSKVERAIRHAIEVAWNRGKIENINNLFGIKVYSDNEKPTNGEFIALVADKMLIEGA